MLRTLFSLKTLLAMLIILAGAYAAGYDNSPLQRMVIMFVAAAIALFVGTDFDDRKEAAERRAREKQRPGKLTDHPQFQNYLDVGADPVLIVENAKVAVANFKARQLLGEQIVGQSVRIAFRHAGAIERLSDPDAQHDGRPTRLIGIGLQDQVWEMRIRNIDHEQKLVHLADRSGAQAAEKMRVDFVANASHELLTPLAGVKGFIETLQDTEAGSDEQTRARFLKIMDDETSRMQALIRDLMSISRIEAEKHHLSDTKVQLENVIQEIVGPLHNGPDPRGHGIALDFSPDLNPVMGDAGQLRQLVSNLIANAMKYGKDGTPINVKLESTRSGTMLSLMVSDQGDGIAAEHIPRLTERFYRIDAGRSKAIGGTGLGLSLVKHIVEGHRGHLEIRSKQGVGTDIRVLLPVAAEAKVEESADTADGDKNDTVT